MDIYEIEVKKALEHWKKQMRKKPSIINKSTKQLQKKFNGILPEKYHNIMTSTIKNMVKAVLSGSEFIAKRPWLSITLEEREKKVANTLDSYKKAAMVEGAGTGAGGFLLSLADFPLLISIKMKFLYDVAALYGFDVKDYRERLYILHVFQLAFSSQERVNEIFGRMENWDSYVKTLPQDINDFEWRSFQQEYRDYIDLAKLMQMIPGIGVVVGAYVNNKLMEKLGQTAMNCYRMRLLH